MAGVKISQLPSGGSPRSTDLIPVARNNNTFSVSIDTFLPITEPNLSTNSVSNRAISANVISLDKIRTIPGNRVLGNNTASTGNVLSVQVSEGMIADDAVTSAKIKENEVKTTNIADDAVTYPKIQNIVTANRVLGSTTANSNVAETQVLEAMIADDAVTSAKIKDGEVKEGNIATDAVTRNKIKNNEVLFSKIQQIGNIGNRVLGYVNANTNAQAVTISTNFIDDNTITYPKIQKIVTANRVLGSTTANSNVSEIQITPSLLSVGAPSWDASGNLNLTGIITQTGRVRPTGWGGGITTFDVYSDGGTIGAGSGATIRSYINSSGLGWLGDNLFVNTGSNPLKITGAWSNYPAENRKNAEISNDTGTYETLMIVGNRSQNANVRRVSIWDRLEINGNLTVSQNATIDGTVTTDYITVNKDINLKDHMYVDYNSYIYGKDSNAANETFLLLNHTNDFSYIQYAKEGLIIRSTTNSREAIKIAGGTDNRDVTIRGNCAVGGNLQVNNNLDVDGSIDLNDRPMFACRAWVNFNGTRNQANTGPSVNGQNVFVRGSQGIERVVKRSAGRYEVLFSSRQPNSNYAVIGNCGGSGSGQNNIVCFAADGFSEGLYNQDSFNVTLYENNNNSTEDATIINCVVFG